MTVRRNASKRVTGPGTGLTERDVELPDGRRLRAVVAGDTGPLVVFEAGMSAPAASWVHTQREVSAHARTLAYDRAGYGGSDVDARERTLERATDDLAALLDALGETEPAVFVGHSWGGPILRLFAARLPERVAALVFVDATLAEGIPANGARRIALSFRVMSALARLGAGELIMRMSLPRGLSPAIDDEDRAILVRDYASVPAMRAGAREARHIDAALPTMRRLQTTGTPDVPTVCLQGGRADRGTAAIRPVLNDTAAALMAAVPNGNGSTVVVDTAGHLIPQEAPEIVRDTILDVLARIRHGESAEETANE